MWWPEAPRGGAGIEIMLSRQRVTVSAEAPRGGAGIEISRFSRSHLTSPKPLVEGLVLKSFCITLASRGFEAPRGGAGIEIGWR